MCVSEKKREGEREGEREGREGGEGRRREFRGCMWVRVGG